MVIYMFQSPLTQHVGPGVRSMKEKLRLEVLGLGVEGSGFGVQGFAGDDPHPNKHFETPKP